MHITTIQGGLEAILQAKIDNEYQGRVMTLFGSIINLSGPIGLIAAGPVSDVFGIQIWFITGGVLIFVNMMFGFFNMPLLSMDRGPDQAAQGTMLGKTGVRNPIFLLRMLSIRFIPSCPLELVVAERMVIAYGNFRV